MKKSVWTDRNVELLANAWKNGGIKAVRELFPDKSDPALYAVAKKYGLAGASTKRAPKAAAKKMTARERLLAKVAARKAEIAETLARIDGLAAEEQRRKEAVEERKRQKAISKVKRRFDAAVASAERLRAEILAIDPETPLSPIAASPSTTPPPCQYERGRIFRRDAHRAAARRSRAHPAAHGEFYRAGAYA